MAFIKLVACQRLYFLVVAAGKSTYFLLRNAAWQKQLYKFFEAPATYPGNNFNNNYSNFKALNLIQMQLVGKHKCYLLSLCIKPNFC